MIGIFYLLLSSDKKNYEKKLKSSIFLYLSKKKSYF